QPVSVSGQTRLQINVEVFSAVPDHLNADVELTKVPAEWQLEGNKKRGIHVDRENARHVSRFRYMLPSNTPNGVYPIEANILWHGKVWKAGAIVRVLRADAPAPTNP